VRRDHDRDYNIPPKGLEDNDSNWKKKGLLGEVHLLNTLDNVVQVFLETVSSSRIKTWHPTIVSAASKLDLLITKT
jgi:hypothetical protein